MSFQSISNYRKTFPKEFKNQKNFVPKSKWWTPLSSGLLVEPTAKHYKAIGSAIWLFLYFLTYANRTTGKLFRKRSTIAHDLGLSLRTIDKNLHPSLTGRIWKEMARQSVKKLSIGHRDVLFIIFRTL